MSSDDLQRELYELMTTRSKTVVDRVCERLQGLTQEEFDKALDTMLEQIDGKPAESESAGLDLKYFVMKPRGRSDYAIASRRAMRCYAEWIQVENPRLASELISWVLAEDQRAGTTTLPPEVDTGKRGS